jgi:hypothetical protein
LNRSRKNRQKKKDEVYKKSELENEGQKERGEDIMEDGKEDTGGLKEVEVEVGRGSDAEEVAP